jgi:hypothetical protein
LQRLHLIAMHPSGSGSQISSQDGQVRFSASWSFGWIDSGVNT